MNLEQIKKDLEDFRYNRKKSNQGRYGIWTTLVYASPIDKHLEELIAEVEIERNRNKMLDKINLEQSLKLQAAEEVIRFYANKENWVLPVTISGPLKELAQII